MPAMDLGMAGKVALVTAASKGLGRGAALALSHEGARVVICARDPERLAATAAELPGEALALPADVTEPDAPARLVAATVERFGGLDILVANAGGPSPARALDVEDDQMLGAINANLLTSIRLVQAAIPHMRQAEWGRICLITSYSVKQPIPTLAYSNTARTGLWAWAKTAAQDLIGDGITLNLACPGPHATERARELGITGPMGDPQDFGKVVAFLCSEQAGFVSGAALQVDGAGTLGLL
jgi:3-oxoacyl-[acyl-carrier protein] reductase